MNKNTYVETKKMETMRFLLLATSIIKLAPISEHVLFVSSHLHMAMLRCIHHDFLRTEIFIKIISTTGDISVLMVEVQKLVLISVHHGWIQRFIILIIKL